MQLEMIFYINAERVYFHKKHLTELFEYFCT